ncbi:MAG: methyltransferase, partial [Elusimicrobia bacterium]|nr:methyltransferase [Elusimicrobiota bacterium]
MNSKTAVREPSGAPVLPDKIMQLGMAFWASKTLLSAVEMGIFTHLAKRPEDLEGLKKCFGLHPRAARDFFDALVALGMLERRDGVYSNTPESAAFLDSAKPSYMGGILEMANNRLYPFWGSLTEGLKTGLPQNEAKSGGNPFDVLYKDPARLKEFCKAMTGISLGAAHAIASKFPWQNYKTFLDVGTTQGALPVTVAKAHRHLRGVGMDLPVVEPVFREYVGAAGLGDRLSFATCDFFTQDLPKADVIVMGHILHDWNLEQKKMLIGKAYKSLPEGGALVIY